MVGEVVTHLQVNYFLFLIKVEEKRKLLKLLHVTCLACLVIYCDYDSRQRFQRLINGIL